MGSHSVTCHPAEVTFPPLRRAVGLLLSAVQGGEISVDSGGAGRPPAAMLQHGAQQQMRAVSRLQLT